MNKERKAALIAGIGLVLMAVLAAVSYLSGLKPLIFTLDFSILASKINLVILYLILFSMVALLDFVVAWSLHGVFRAEQKGLSLAMAITRTVYGIIFLVSQGFLWSYPKMLGQLPVDPPSHYYETFLANWVRFEGLWSLSLILFGVHLILLGILILRNKKIHSLFAWLLFPAGLGYMVDSIGELIYPGSVWSLSSYTFIGEVLLIIGLFILALKKGAPPELSEQ